MKRKLLIAGAALALTVPTIVAAEGLMGKADSKGAIQGVNSPSQYGQGMGGNCQENDFQRGMGKHHKGMRHVNRFEERKTELLGFVEKYAPDTLADWKKAVEERDALKEKWLSDEYAEERQTWISEKRSQMEGIRDQFNNGEITREEMKEKMQQLRGKAEKIGLYKELQSAVTEENSDSAAKILGQMLEQFKERNEELKTRLEAAKK